jgi:hypothetical protein
VPADVLAELGATNQVEEPAQTVLYTVHVRAFGRHRRLSIFLWFVLGVAGWSC